MTGPVNPANAGYQRERHRRKKADGICTRCAERRVKGRTLCARHVEMMAGRPAWKPKAPKPVPPLPQYVSREPRIERTGTPADVVCAVSSSWSISRAVG